MKIAKVRLLPSLFTLMTLWAVAGWGCAPKPASGSEGEKEKQGTAVTNKATTEGKQAPASTPASETQGSGNAPAVIQAEPVGTEIEWLTLEEAYARNQAEPRKIFVDVYTDWCSWCKKMDRETFADPEVAAYVNENYYAVKLNAESDREFEMAGQKMTERQVARQLGVRSYPTVILIHEDFQKYQPAPGYRPALAFLELIKGFKAINIPQN